jgi:hypothetical protein
MSRQQQQQPELPNERQQRCRRQGGAALRQPIVQAAEQLCHSLLQLPACDMCQIGNLTCFISVCAHACIADPLHLLFTLAASIDTSRHFYFVSALPPAPTPVELYPPHQPQFCAYHLPGSPS